MAVTVTMLAPAPYAIFAVRSGANYTAGANGLITGVPLTGTDINDLLHSGCVIASDAANIGTPGTFVTAAEFGDAYSHTTILTFGAGAVLPSVTGSLGVGKLIYTFPAGAQIIKSSRMSVGIQATTTTTMTPTVGLGTVIASGAVIVLSGTATFQNINVGKAAADTNNTATVQTVKATSSPFELVTETGGVKAVYFNAACAWTGTEPGMALSGSVALDWKTLA